LAPVASIDSAAAVSAAYAAAAARQPVLAAEHERRDPRAVQRLAAGKSLAAVLGAAHTDRDLRHAGHLAYVGRPDRGRLGHDRVHAGVQHGRQDLRGRDPGARSPAGDAVEAHGERGAHDLGGERRADPAAVRHDEEALLALDLLLGQPGVLAVADLACQAVDGLAVGEGPVHHARLAAILARVPPSSSTRAPPATASRSSIASGASVMVTVVMGLLQCRRGCPLPRT
jgi:hypothetical protein